MFLRFSALVSLICLPAMGGCVSLDNVVGGIANTPEWFQERRVEIRGEGYPDLNTVPVTAPISDSRNRLELSTTEAASARQTLFGSPRSALADITLAEMQSIAADLRPQLPQITPRPEGFMTESEIAALRAQVESR